MKSSACLPPVPAASTSGTEGEEGMLGMIGRFSADGSLEALLSLLNWTAATLESVGLLR